MPFWPFRRRSRDATMSASPAQPAVEGAPVPGPDRAAPVQRVADTAPAAATPRPPTNAWRDLTPLRSVAQDFPLTAPVQRLADGLTSLHPPPLAVGRLGHLRSGDAPTGVVHGMLHPTAPPTAGSSSGGRAVVDRPLKRPPGLAEGLGGRP